MVKTYLEGFFLAGNVNKTDRMSAKEMVMQLKNLAEEGEIQESEVPEVKTVEGWITRYSASLRKEAAEKRVLRETNKRLENESNNVFKVEEKWFYN
ncbi:hypothetical protein C1646_764819 [Rhizophagus diaphanus]|nr:hypothetical protein C1646_764819 [Rhizophagus diaphanus] [Rhizophagus sp. MUCL 43196]